MGANATGMGAKTPVMLSLLANEEILAPLTPLDLRPFWIIDDLKISMKELHEIVDGRPLNNLPGSTRRVVAPGRSDPEGVHVRGHLLDVATRLAVIRQPVPIVCRDVPGPEPEIDDGDQTTGPRLSVLLEPTCELPQVVLKPLILRPGVHAFILETCPQPTRLSLARHRIAWQSFPTVSILYIDCLTI